MELQHDPEDQGSDHWIGEYRHGPDDQDDQISAEYGTGGGGRHRRRIRRPGHGARARDRDDRSEEHTSELQSLMRNSYAVLCLKKKTKKREHKLERGHYRHVDR